MRTSRISRDTSRIVTAALGERSSRRTRSGANVVRDFGLNAFEAGNAASHGARDSALGHRNGSEELNVQIDSTSINPVAEDKETVRNGKRKRGQDTTGASSIKRRPEGTISVTTSSSAENVGKPKKTRRTPAKKTRGTDGTIKVEPPPNWDEVYALTREMRNENIAPVDTMGCESLADRLRTPRDQRFQTLVALMLSSQTKDTVTSVAIKGMQENMPGGFNLASVLSIEPAALNAFISKVGFHNLKTKYIKAAAEILRDEWNSDIPDTIEGLTSLPGVGPKMAYLCMSAAWGRDEGIGVDVHVHRITNLWGWHKTKQPEETRAALESWLPKDRWHDINNLLVGFGQTICLPVGRKCGECKLADRGLCPSAVVPKTAKVRKREVTVKIEGAEGDAVVNELSVAAEKIDVKAEDTFVNTEVELPDIEDIGTVPSRRARTK